MSVANPSIAKRQTRSAALVPSRNAAVVSARTQYNQAMMPHDGSDRPSAESETTTSGTDASDAEATSRGNA